MSLTVRDIATEFFLALRKEFVRLNIATACCEGFDERDHIGVMDIMVHPEDLDLSADVFGQRIVEPAAAGIANMLQERKSAEGAIQIVRIPVPESSETKASCSSEVAGFSVTVCLQNLMLKRLFRVSFQVCYRPA
jgi:hypothetical protein